MLTGSVGSFLVRTTDGRGLSVEEISEDLLEKIIHISDTAHPAIRDQAVAYKDSLRPLIIHYMKQAVKSDRTTLAAQLAKDGQENMAAIIRRL